MKNIVIGTRGSILALAQAESVKKIVEKEGYSCEIKIINTSGDMRLDVLSGNGILKEMFVKEIEEELLAGKIDIAVHSLKDVPSYLPKGLKIGATPLREECRDTLVLRDGVKYEELEKGKIVGTSSIRRRAEIEGLISGCTVKEIRGNIHTRLNKLDSGEYDVLILAAAGLKRAGLEGRISKLFDITEMTPAPGQGAIAVEVRENDEEINILMTKINDLKIEKAVKTEREFAAYFGGGCHSPVGAYCEIKEGTATLYGSVLRDGTMVKKSIICDEDEMDGLAERLYREY